MESKQPPITDFYFSRTNTDSRSGAVGHYHDDYEVYYLQSGRCEYFIDNAIYTLSPGDTVIIPSGVIHKTNYGAGTHLRYLVNCPKSIIPSTVLNKLHNEVFILRKNPCATEIERLMSQIGKEYESPDDYSEAAITSLLCELFILLARHSASAKEEDSTGFIEGALEYINNNYTSEITLNEVAKRFSVSAEHLSRSFKERTGFGFSEYVNLLRLKLAEYMLIHEPGKSVLKIAYACGFNDSNYFCTKFKGKYGIPPSALKKQTKK